MNALDLVKLTPLMEIPSDRPEFVVGLIDGAVFQKHPELVGANVREISGELSGQCVQASSTACVHETFVAGILCGKRNSTAPAICSNGTLFVRSIFAKTALEREQMPS
jgi:hypothetical protein